jgi:hypothetical protein
MQSEPKTQEKIEEKIQEKTQEIDPKDVGITPETEPPGRIYKQVVREVLARIDQRLADIERHTVTEPPGGQPQGGERAPRGARLKRGLIGLLAVAGVIGGVLLWQRSDSEAAKAVVARFTPRFVTNILSTQDNQEAAQGSDAVTVGTAGDPSASPDAPAAATDRTTAEVDGQNAVSTPADLATTIEKMSRDMVTLAQGIEQLKASQEQLSRDNAKAAEQFKASEDQLIRMLLRVSEQQTPQPKSVAATPPRTRTPQQARTAASPPRATAARPRQGGLPGLFSRRPT